MTTELTIRLIAIAIQLAIWVAIAYTAYGLGLKTGFRRGFDSGVLEGGNAIIKELSKRHAKQEDEPQEDDKQ